MPQTSPGFSGGPPAWAVVEAAVLIVIAIGLVWPVRASFKRLVGGIPRGFAWCLLLGISLLLGGHAMSDPEETYPFPAWDMYTVSNPGDVRFVEYEAELSTGRRERLLIAELFPAGGRHFRARLDEAAYAAEHVPPGSNESRTIADLEALLAAVAYEHDTRNPEDPIRRIRLWVCTIPPRDYRGPESISRRLLREYSPL
jgi:hypothetical protein